jgi:hypothetical protein
MNASITYWRKLLVASVVGVALLMFIMAACGGGSGTISSPSPIARLSLPSTPPPTAAPTAPPMPTPNAVTGSCAPVVTSPCVYWTFDGGTFMKVTNLVRNVRAAEAPSAGQHFVRVDFQFIEYPANSGNGLGLHIDPTDFTLTDSAGVINPFTFLVASGCEPWQAVDLSATAQTFGPRSICFEASGAPNGVLQFTWNTQPSRTVVLP